jgi:hypothetical protein
VGRLVINNAMTVNGAFEAPSPDEWLVLDPDSNNVSLEQFLVADAMVLGRKTYEGVAAVWPKLAGAGPAAAAAPRPPPLGPGAPPAERLAAFYAAMVDLLERHVHLARGPRWASAASPPAPPGSGAPRPRAAGRGRRASRRSRRPGRGAAGAAGAGGLPVSAPGARPHPAEITGALVRLARAVLGPPEPG